MKNDRIMISKNTPFLRGGEEVKNKRVMIIFKKSNVILQA
jgi:hypothetical protein